MKKHHGDPERKALKLSPVPHDMHFCLLYIKENSGLLVLWPTNSNIYAHTLSYISC